MKRTIGIKNINDESAKRITSANDASGLSKILGGYDSLKEVKDRIEWQCAIVKSGKSPSVVSVAKKGMFTEFTFEI
jgi:hypothetical protein